MEEVTEFTYLGFIHSATGSQPDILRRTGIASTAHEHSLTTVSASTADETPLIPDMYTVHPNV